MSAFEIYGRPVLAVRTMTDGRRAGQTTCMLPGPTPGEFCSLPEGHEPEGDHEVQVLGFITIGKFHSDTENPMNPSDQEKRDAAAKRAKHTDDIAAKPARPRTKPTPRDVRPERKPDER